MLIVPALKASVPFVVVIRTLSRVPPRLAMPPEKLAPSVADADDILPLATHVLPVKFIMCIAPEYVAAAVLAFLVTNPAVEADVTSTEAAKPVPEALYPDETTPPEVPN